MSTQLFVNINDVLSRSSISGNVDTDKIVPSISTAQEIELKPLIGDGLYNKLSNIIGDGTISDPGNEWYNTLWLEYITPVTVFYTLEYFLPFHAYTIANAGVNKHQGDNLETVSKTEVDYLVQKYRNQGDAYANQMQEYLCKYSSHFPEYNQNDIIYPNGANYRTGLYLG